MIEEVVSMKFDHGLLRLNQRGYVLALTMYLLLLLTVIGVAAIQTSTVEKQIAGNTKRMVEDFYATEGALITAMERTDWWLSDDFLNSDTATANWVGKVDFNKDTIDDAMVEIRCIDQNNSVISTLSDAANDIPADRHSAPPPIGSGYSIRYFYTRKFAVTATSLRSSTKLQSGVSKVFNKHF